MTENRTPLDYDHNEARQRLNSISDRELVAAWLEVRGENPNDLDSLESYGYTSSDVRLRFSEAVDAVYTDSDDGIACYDFPPDDPHSRRWAIGVGEHNPNTHLELLNAVAVTYDTWQVAHRSNPTVVVIEHPDSDPSVYTSDGVDTFELSSYPATSYADSEADDGSYDTYVDTMAATANELHTRGMHEAAGHCTLLAKQFTDRRNR